MTTPRSSSNFSLVAIGAAPGFLSLIREAGERAFPGANVTSAPSLADALKNPALAEVELIAMLDPGCETAGEAAAALDAMQLPRYGVLKFTGAAAPLENDALAVADWNARTLAPLLQQAAELQRMRRENARFRGEFLAFGTRVVHDLRSPLGGILTSAEVIKEVLQDEAPASVSLTEPLLESTDGLTKLIRQLATFAKATAGSNPKTRVNMSVPFWAAFQQVERHALALGATVRQPASWPDVEGEPSWLQAMWHALLSNSLQHAGTAPRIEVGWTRTQDETRFWVIDGSEIPPAKQSTLFTPFHLLHHPNAPRGFGLPILRRLAELQGGRCGYECLPGEGFCFFFTLPLIEGGNGG
ncbi:MAG TPA: HAMP domain-containing sensor histidine kinase [Opitutaceae bacterium]|nr:HAMP domain-containing sensor histidine kinase [Opitutaceae bacterium]